MKTIDTILTVSLFTILGYQILQTFLHPAKKNERKSKKTAKAESSEKNTIDYSIIGKVRSVFPQKFGCPRQGILAPSTKGVIEIDKSLKQCISDLENYSHIWIFWDFHLNSNRRKVLRVKPPRLKGKKTGSCSSRSPYRPNSLGMSLLKLERIEDYRIYVSGVDVVDGTPIVDIKPYTMYDRLESFKQPDWISESNQTLTTSFSHSMQHQLSNLLEESPSNFYKDDSLAMQRAIEEVINLDPRKNKKSFASWLFFEHLAVGFSVVDGLASVIDLQLLDKIDQKSWKASIENMKAV